MVDENGQPVLDEKGAPIPAPKTKKRASRSKKAAAEGDEAGGDGTTTEASSEDKPKKRSRKKKAEGEEGVKEAVDPNAPKPKVKRKPPSRECLAYHRTRTWNHRPVCFVLFCQPVFTRSCADCRFGS